MSCWIWLVSRWGVQDCRSDRALLPTRVALRRGSERFWIQRAERGRPQSGAGLLRRCRENASSDRRHPGGRDLLVRGHDVAGAHRHADQRLLLGHDRGGRGAEPGSHDQNREEVSLAQAAQRQSRPRYRAVPRHVPPRPRSPAAGSSTLQSCQVPSVRATRTARACSRGHERAATGSFLAPTYICTNTSKMVNVGSAPPLLGNASLQHCHHHHLVHFQRIDPFPRPHSPRPVVPQNSSGRKGPPNGGYI
jgi:hypothetical protein